MTSVFQIGILSYNHPDITRRTIQSCLQFVRPFQITLLHNGSETRWVKQLQNEYPELIHLILPNNKGFTSGANELLSQVFKHSDWCLFLTNDTQLLKIQMPDHAGLYAPLIFRRKIGIVDSLGGLFNVAKGQLQHCRHSEAWLKAPDSSFRYVPGTAFWMHKEIFDAAGFFDESLGTYWEDVDYSMRVQIKNLRLGLQESTTIVHSVGKTCHKKAYYTAFLFHRNRYKITMRYLKRWDLKLVFLMQFLKELVLSIGLSVCRKDFPSAKLKLNLLRSIFKAD